MIKYGRQSIYRYAVQIEGDRVTLDSDVLVPWNREDAVVNTIQGEKNRLDLLSTRTLGNPLLWWILAKRNNIKFPFKLEVGREIYIPSSDSLYGVGGVIRE